MRRIFRVIRNPWFLSLAGFVLAIFFAAYLAVTASLPQLTGTQVLSALSTEVAVDRDAYGVVTLSGASRSDVAAALGFVHAQERFFQMDLLRRKAAGELAALMGEGALPHDRDIRVHRLRAVAKQSVANLGPNKRRILDSYVAGVNQGLQALGAVPFEYLVLGQSPAKWQAEDSALVVLAMFIELQDTMAARDQLLADLTHCLPEPAISFLVPRSTRWDAALDGSNLPLVERPEVEVYSPRSSFVPEANSSELSFFSHDVAAVGSNHWGVGGEQTDHGGALLAGDMHLSLSVPNTWFRARLIWSEEHEAHDLVGVTLPGVPTLVAGSNGHIAWTFTNSYVDTSDIVMAAESEDEKSYFDSEQWIDYAQFVETIHVRGAPSETLNVRWTELGPRIDDDALGRPRVLAWAAYFPGAVDPVALIDLERARTTQNALPLAQKLGIPAQNFLAVDHHGDLGWTIAGRLAIGRAASGPSSYSFAKARWRDWRQESDYPQVTRRDGFLWTANNRVSGAQNYLELGDGGFALGARAGQIRRRLDEKSGTTPINERDMLWIQLDSEAQFLERWRDLLLKALKSNPEKPSPSRTQFISYVENWSGRAGVDDVGYRLVRAFRLFLADDVFDLILQPCRRLTATLPFQRYVQWEYPLWALVSERPSQFVNPRYSDWDEQINAVIDRVEAYFSSREIPLERATWGQRNTLTMVHPLTYGMPLLSAWLNMPMQPLAGDENMPRVQGPGFGASQRIVVAPGRESEGFFHMPGGQSGHPLSPFYKKGHEDWAAGAATPLLPRSTAFGLKLVPAEGS